MPGFQEMIKKNMNPDQNYTLDQTKWTSFWYNDKQMPTKDKLETPVPLAKVLLILKWDQYHQAEHG